MPGAPPLKAVRSAVGMRQQVRATLTCRCKCALLIPSTDLEKHLSDMHLQAYMLLSKRRTSIVHLLCLWNMLPLIGQAEKYVSSLSKSPKPC